MLLQFHNISIGSQKFEQGKMQTLEGLGKYCLKEAYFLLNDNKILFFIFIVKFSVVKTDF